MYGVEGDLSGTLLNSNLNVSPQSPIGTTATANANADIDWYGTARGRLGWSQGPWLLYGTGGLAFGHADLSSSISSATLALSSQTSSVRAGWVAGAGINYMWSPNVILSLNYQYIDLGKLSVGSSATSLAGETLVQNANSHAQFQIVTAGLSWLFYPSAQQPWEGAYAGGHAGGAWGNDTDASYYYAPVLTASDLRLKRDIALIDRLDDGLGLYRFRYLWSDTVYVGVMAQEVALRYPNAVVHDPSGYLRVDYSQLGLKFMTLSEWDALGGFQSFAN